MRRSINLSCSTPEDSLSFGAVHGASPEDLAFTYEIFLVAGDHTCTDLIAQTLVPHPLQLTQFESAESFLIHIMRHPLPAGVARIAFMKIMLKGMSGMEALEQIQKLEPGTRVVLLAEEAQAVTVLSAWHTGASDLILAPYTVEKIIGSMQRAIRARAQAQHALLSHESEEYRKAYAHLTRREREVGQLVADGRRNHQIAEQLHISMATVKMHRANLMRKLNLTNAAQLSAFYHKCNV